MPIAIADTGPLILLADKESANVALEWLESVQRLDISVLVPAGVATEFLRGARDETRAYWWLSHMQGLNTTYDTGRRAGRLLRSLADNAVSVVDAQVVQHAIELGAAILTSDPDDIRRLVGVSGTRILVRQLPWPS